MSSPQPADISNYLATPQPTEPERELKKIFPASAVRTIFDIGCCEGEDSVRYSQRFPRAQIHSFEPLPGNQELVRQNLARYPATRATLVPLALSHQIGEATFHLSSGRPQNEFAGKEFNYGNKSSSLLAPASGGPMYGWVEFKESITVRTSTLDHYCAEHGIKRIDFIHMDVQGAESLVLQGARRMLPHITALWMEVSDQELYRGQALRGDLEAFMHAQGFRLGYERRLGIEGDQFYVNTRHVRTWPYLAWRPTRRLLGRVKRAVGL